MAITNKEKITLTKQRDALVQLIKEQGTTGAGIDITLKDLKKADNFNKAQWDKAHINILRYEQEIESMTGEHVIDPLSQTDVTSLAYSGGRLYQNPTSTNAKKIPQFNGAPIGTARAHELDNVTQINDTLNILTSGLGNSGTGSLLDASYTAGDPTIRFQDIVSVGWVLVGGATLLKISGGSSTASCDLPQFTTQNTCLAGGGVWGISNAYTVTARINDADYIMNSTVSPVWNGFTNTERLNKSAGAAQGIMDSLVSTLQGHLNKWLNYLNQSYNASVSNPADNQNISDVSTHLLHKTSLTDYLVTTPIEDGASGIGSLQSLISTRNSFIGQRYLRAKVAKTSFYASRYSFTNARSDVQSGTLKRVLFLEGLKVQGGFTPGGTVEQKNQLANLNNLLASA